MLMRHGVKLSPKQADIYDMIEHSGSRGVLPDVLRWVFYPDSSKRNAQLGIQVHINQINDRMGEAGIQVCNEERFAPYRVYTEEEANLIRKRRSTSPGAIRNRRWRAKKAA
jgi:hypothetical protein